MPVISNKEFRDNQIEYMDRVDRGEQVIIRRGRNRAYAITPIKKSDFPSSQDTNDFLSGAQIKEQIHQHIDKIFSK